MAEYELVEDYYLLPTPAGAFYAVSGSEDEPIRNMILTLLSGHSSPKLSVENLRSLLSVDDDQRSMELLHRAQTLAWVQGIREPRQVLEQGAGQGLQELLPRLSSLGKGLLVDWNGLPLVRSGLSDSAAEALSALSADLIAVQNRHADRLAETLGLGVQGWAAVDAYGSSRVGAWPMFIGESRLMLVLLGEPRLNQPEFINLVWILITRYGSMAA